MTIPPDLYEKYSGRTGDPMLRRGAAMAQNSARSGQRKAQKDRSFSSRLMEGHAKAVFVRWILGAVFSIIVLILMAGRR